MSVRMRSRSRAPSTKAKGPRRARAPETESRAFIPAILKEFVVYDNVGVQVREDELRVGDRRRPCLQRRPDSDPHLRLCEERVERLRQIAAEAQGIRGAAVRDSHRVRKQ